jgi:small subunit ribosomal protein S18
MMAAKGKRGKTNSDRPTARTRPGFGPARRKSCFLCKDKVAEVDYKEVDKLRRYVSDRGRIRSPKITGACRRHQRQVAVAIKRAREMALLPYVGPNDAPATRPRSGGGDRGRS